MAKDFDAVEINLLSSFFISQFRYYYEHQSKLANASSATNTMIRYASSGSLLSLHLPVLYVVEVSLRRDPLDVAAVLTVGHRLVSLYTQR